MALFSLCLSSPWELGHCWHGDAPQPVHCGATWVYPPLLPPFVPPYYRWLVCATSGPMLALPSAHLLLARSFTNSGAVCVSATAMARRITLHCICSSSAIASATAAILFTLAWCCWP